MKSAMKRNLALVSLLIAAIGLASAPAKSKKHASLPEEFESAHTVFVESRDGHDITDISLDPDTRNAIQGLCFRLRWSDVYERRRGQS